MERIPAHAGCRASWGAGGSTGLCHLARERRKVVEILTPRNQLSSLNKISHLPEEAWVAWQMIAAGGPQCAMEAA
jgi:hypothetical protein